MNDSSEYKMIKHIPPPNYNTLKKFFPTINFDKGTVFTYYPHIYMKGHPQPHLLIHEQTHLTQQKKITPSMWWYKYISDPEFRLHEEVEAYHNQYKHTPSILHKIAVDLSSPLYGFTISYEYATFLIIHGQ